MKDKQDVVNLGGMGSFLSRRKSMCEAGDAASQI